MTAYMHLLGAPGQLKIRTSNHTTYDSMAEACQSVREKPAKQKIRFTIERPDSTCEDIGNTIHPGIPFENPFTAPNHMHVWSKNEIFDACRRVSQLGYKSCDDFAMAVMSMLMGKHISEPTDLDTTAPGLCLAEIAHTLHEKAFTERQNQLSMRRIIELVRQGYLVLFTLARNTPHPARPDVPMKDWHVMMCALTEQGVTLFDNNGYTMAEDVIANIKDPRDITPDETGKPRLIAAIVKGLDGLEATMLSTEELTKIILACDAETEISAKDGTTVDPSTSEMSFRPLTNTMTLFLDSLRIHQDIKNYLDENIDVLANASSYAHVRPTQSSISVNVDQATYQIEHQLSYEKNSDT